MTRPPPVAFPRLDARCSTPSIAAPNRTTHPPWSRRTRRLPAQNQVLLQLDQRLRHSLQRWLLRHVISRIAIRLNDQVQVVQVVMKRLPLRLLDPRLRQPVAPNTPDATCSPATARSPPSPPRRFDASAAAPPSAPGSPAANPRSAPVAGPPARTPVLDLLQRRQRGPQPVNPLHHRLIRPRPPGQRDSSLAITS